MKTAEATPGLFRKRGLGPVEFSLLLGRGCFGRSGPWRSLLGFFGGTARLRRGRLGDRRGRGAVGFHLGRSRGLDRAGRGGRRSRRLRGRGLSLGRFRNGLTDLLKVIGDDRSERQVGCPSERVG